MKDIKVLIIEDDEKYRSLLKDYFTERNICVCESANGEESVCLAMKELPDVILLDLELPGKNGFEICKEIKSYGSLREIPVILLTSRKEVQDKIRGLMAGANVFIEKGCQLDYIDDCIQRVLNPDIIQPQYDDPRINI